MTSAEIGEWSRDICERLRIPQPKKLHTIGRLGELLFLSYLHSQGGQFRAHCLEESTHLHDFTWGPLRIEVKSSVINKRNKYTLTIERNQGKYDMLYMILIHKDLSYEIRAAIREEVSHLRAIGGLQRRFDRFTLVRRGGRWQDYPIFHSVTL